MASAMASLRPGWVALRGCALDWPPGGAEPVARVSFALLHPLFGIALLDLVPGVTTPDAARRLRRLLDASGFTARFGEHPPIVYLCMPLRLLPELVEVLEPAFEGQRQVRLSGGPAWAQAAQRLLSAGAEAPPLPSADGAVTARQVSAGARTGWLLAGFAAVLTMAIGGGAVALYYLGPPKGLAVGRWLTTGAPEGAAVAPAPPQAAETAARDGLAVLVDIHMLPPPPGK